MLPKVHFTSEVVSHFVRTLLREDPMKFGIKMESTVLAGLPTRNGEIFEPMGGFTLLILITLT